MLIKHLGLSYIEVYKEMDFKDVVILFEMLLADKENEIKMQKISDGRMQQLQERNKRLGK